MSLTSATKNVLIGDLLVASGMTTQRNMADAVPISLKTGLPIGRVLIGAAALTEAHLQQALLAQSLIRDSLLTTDLGLQALRIVVREGFDLHQALEIVGWHPEAFTSENRLGQLLLLAGAIDQEQLDLCLTVFYSAGLPLARVLVLKGIINNLVAYVALTSQQMLRDNKLTREQAIQAVQAARASRATIEDAYLMGYLRMRPSNHIRLGELLVRASLVDDDEVVLAVEQSIKQGLTLGEVLLGRGAISEECLTRALEAQRLVTEGILDADKASNILRKANYERLSVKAAMSHVAPEMLLSEVLQGQQKKKQPLQEPVYPQKPLAEHSAAELLRQQRQEYEEQQFAGKDQSFQVKPNQQVAPAIAARTQADPIPSRATIGAQTGTAGPSQPPPGDRLMDELVELITIDWGRPIEEQLLAILPVTVKRRSEEEVRARELVSRLQAKLEALNTRNDYLGNMLNTKMPRLRATASTSTEAAADITNFDSAMQFIEKLFASLEASAYRNGYLISTVDTGSTQANLQQNIKQLQAQLEDYQKRLHQAETRWHDSDSKLKKALEERAETEVRLRAAETATQQHVHENTRKATGVGNSAIPHRAIDSNATPTKANPLVKALIHPDPNNELSLSLPVAVTPASTLVSSLILQGTREPRRLMAQPLHLSRLNGDRMPGRKKKK